MCDRHRYTVQYMYLKYFHNAYQTGYVSTGMVDNPACGQREIAVTEISLSTWFAPEKLVL